MADQNKKQSGGFNPIGLCMGMGVGLCFGVAMNNMALGICMDGRGPVLQRGAGTACVFG